MTIAGIAYTPEYASTVRTTVRQHATAFSKPHWTFSLLASARLWQLLEGNNVHGFDLGLSVSWALIENVSKRPKISQAHCSSAPSPEQRGASPAHLHSSGLAAAVARGCSALMSVPLQTVVHSTKVNLSQL